MSIVDHRRHQCTLCVNRYANMHCPSTPNSIFPVKSSLFERGVHVLIEHNGRRYCSHDQCCKRWDSFLLGRHAAPNALTASLSLCHVNLQVKVDVRGRGCALQHTFSDKLSCRSERYQFFIRSVICDYRLRGSCCLLRYLSRG